MWFLEIVRVAFGALVANKFRAVLTMLGIIIGVGAVIAMMAMGEGAKKSVQEQIASMIDSHLTVRSGVGSSISGRELLTYDDYHAVRQDARFVRTVVPNNPGWGAQPVRYRNKTIPAAVTASVPDYFEMTRLKIAQGRPLVPADGQNRRRVAVLGANVAKKLNAGPRMIGDYIRIEAWLGGTYQVVGVLEPRGKAGWANPDDEIVVPLETWSWRVDNQPRLFFMYVQLTDENRIVEASEEISRILRRSRHLRPGQQSDFTVTPTIDFGAVQKQTSETFSSLLLGIAAVSLIVGGIGVMNIMLVSVTERTREIGVRKAIGATRTAILGQFILEAVTLCLLGGGLGLAAGYGAARFMSAKAGWSTIVTAQSLVLGIAVSVAIGLFFGIYPAFRAARLDPVEALRYE